MMKAKSLIFTTAMLIGSGSALFADEANASKASPPYRDWRHSGSMHVLTTPEGANLAATTSEEGFPLLVRLHKDFFRFDEAMTNGEDIRFSTTNGTPLSYQIEEWDTAGRTASIWVRLPVIKGNTRQEIHLHWGKVGAASESNGKAVFDESNGYLSVWHMNGPPKDEVDTLKSTDVNTLAAAGMIGLARHFGGSQGIFCGEKIDNYPTGSSSHTTEAWIRSEKANATVVGWGNEMAQGKVVMQFRSPPHINMDCYFSDGNVKSESRLPMAQWVHVVHTYRKGYSRLYANGELDGASTSRASPLAIRSPSHLWIGGWYDNYDFIGDIDEVRISKVARSTDWVKLQYENQKTLQTLTGPVVQPGNAFSVSPSQLSVMEGTSAIVSGEAGGAQKIYWILKKDKKETVVAVDRLRYTFNAGRVKGNTSTTLEFKCVYANDVKTMDIPITVQEDIPEPVFTLKAPPAWDGRTAIEVEAQIENLGSMKAKGAGELNYVWTASGIAVIQENAPGKLILKRAQGSGTLTVTVAVHNGGMPTVKDVKIQVSEPKEDAWIQRSPAKDEKPENNQFYTRDDKNEGTLFFNGRLKETADLVYLKVYADGQIYKKESRALAADKSYAFAVKLKPGLIRYSVEFGSKEGDREILLDSATNIVCGDAFVIQGQSNAVATDWGQGEPTFHSEWIRTFGSMSGSPEGIRLWGDAVYRSQDNEKLQIGYWGMELARRLVENHHIPICILNGAVGGTRIDQHQRSLENPLDRNTIYGRLLWRVQQAKLTHGIRGVFWHQGENDQGADGPTGGFGWETYRQYFIDLAAAWKQDFPNLQHYYIFQIWPKACSMGANGSDNMLREVQRTLPSSFSHMSIMSTLGIEPPGGCHYPAAGYAEIARLICPLVERDNYRKAFSSSITPPNLIRAYYGSDRKDEIVLEFDQPVKWDDTLAGQFYLDGEKGKVTSGVGNEIFLTLKLSHASAAKRISYLDSGTWSQKALLKGMNGIAALTFCNVWITSTTKQ
jgi:hypothetical protein